MEPLLELGKVGGFVYGIFLKMGKSGGFVYGVFIGIGEEWWLRILYLYWSWGIVVASCMVPLLELGKVGGFVYGNFIGVGE